MRNSITFDGTTLTSTLVASNVKRPPSNRSISTKQIPGMDGAVVTGAVSQSSTVSMTLTCFNRDHDSRRDTARWLRSILQTDEPARLAFSDDGGRYYLAMLQKIGETDRIDATSWDVTFSVPDPILYGQDVSATVPSGGSVSIEVGGTYPAALRVTASAAVRGSSGFWGVRLDGGDYMRVALGSDTSRSIDMDSAGATVYVAGDPALMTLDSDWIMLEPGTHTLAMDQGTGAATASWTERWV